MNPLPMCLSLLLLGTVPTGRADGTAQTEEIQEWRGQYGGEEAPAAEVITQPARWAKFWRWLGKAMPPADFTQSCAVVAYAGLRSTGGYAIEFLAPVLQGDDLLVRWRVRPPAPDSYVTQALARPWKVKVFPRPKGSVRVEQVRD